MKFGLCLYLNYFRDPKFSGGEKPIRYTQIKITDD